MENTNHNGIYNHSKPIHLDPKWSIIHGGDHSKQLLDSEQRNTVWKFVGAVLSVCLLAGIGYLLASILGWLPSFLR